MTTYVEEEDPLESKWKPSLTFINPVSRGDHDQEKDHSGLHDRHPELQRETLYRATGRAEGGAGQTPAETLLVGSLVVFLHCRGGDSVCVRVCVTDSGSCSLSSRSQSLRLGSFAQSSKAPVLESFNNQCIDNDGVYPLCCVQGPRDKLTAKNREVGK